MRNTKHCMSCIHSNKQVCSFWSFVKCKTSMLDWSSWSYPQAQGLPNHIHWSQHQKDPLRHLWANFQLLKEVFVRVQHFLWQRMQLSCPACRETPNSLQLLPTSVLCLSSSWSSKLNSSQNVNPFAVRKVLHENRLLEIYSNKMKSNYIWEQV